MHLDALDSIYNGIEEYLVAWLDNKHSRCDNQRPDSCRLDAAPVNFLRLLRRAEIWPRSEYVHGDTTVSSIRARLRVEVKHGNPISCDGGASKCDCAPRDLARVVESVLAEPQEKGLCLGCVEETLVRGKPLKLFEHGNCTQASLRKTFGWPPSESHCSQM